MSPQRVELALEKQRLQMQSATQRDAFAAAATGVMPLFAAADGVRNGVIWLRRNPQWLAGAAVALLVARPRRMLRWVRSGFFAWQTWRRIAQWRIEQTGR